jgi:predicted TIM-barrel fold metal-dependent hydrolase
MSYADKFLKAVENLSLTDNPFDRISKKTNEVFKKKDFYIDTHVHLFDIRCVNKSYFLLRAIKDLLGVKSAAEEYVDINEESIYTHISESGLDAWEEQLENNFEATTHMTLDVNTKGIIDWWNARKFLQFKKMKDVYKYYLDEFSISNIIKKKDVLITALMMDLEMGWGCSLKKPISAQIDELKLLADEFPILPFLACDPRRADEDKNDKNLYSLFAKAFSNTKGVPFFGIKIYPAMGYDPSDYRLLPIYEYCERYKIPVLSHHGGEAVSTGRSDKLIVYDINGKQTTISAKNRKEMAYILNDPQRWASVLEKFPNLKLNLAHFGGTQAWQIPKNAKEDKQKRKETIFEFMKKYPNVFADFSFQLVDEKISRNLREVLSIEEYIRNKTLFGTDYWVVNPQGDLYNEQKKFFEILDQNFLKLDLKELLAFNNPCRYLFG